MDTPSENAGRDIFLWEIAEQFEGLARWVVEPLLADAWEDGSKAVFTVRLDDDELLRFSASFDDEGARQKGWNQRLNLHVEWRGEATTAALVLGWSSSEPDFERGLDSRSDFAEGECARSVGHIVELLRDKLAAALEPDFARAGDAIASYALTKAVPQRC
jgi:hypothetical protein